jgi:hypothetical protein
MNSGMGGHSDYSPRGAIPSPPKISHANGLISRHNPPPPPGQNLLGHRVRNCKAVETVRNSLNACHCPR